CKVGAHEHALRQHSKVECLLCEVCLLLLTDGIENAADELVVTVNSHLVVVGQGTVEVHAATTHATHVFHATHELIHGHRNREIIGMHVFHLNRHVGLIDGVLEDGLYFTRCSPGYGYH